MALIGLKGGGYVTAKALETIGKVGNDVTGMSKDDVDKLLQAKASPYDFHGVPVAMPTDAAAAAQEQANLKLVEGWTPEQTVGYYTFWPHNDKVYHVEDANRKIWREGTLTPSEALKLQKLEAGLKELPTHTGTVHRYMGFHDSTVMANYLSAFQPGKQVAMQGFQSTSQSESTPKSFAGFGYFKGADGVIFKIHATGKNGHNLVGKSKVPGESEVLFQHNAQFKVLKVDAYKGANKTIKHYVELEEV